MFCDLWTPTFLSLLFWDTLYLLPGAIYCLLVLSCMRSFFFLTITLMPIAHPGIGGFWPNFISKSSARQMYGIVQNRVCLRRTLTITHDLTHKCHNDFICHMALTCVWHFWPGYRVKNVIFLYFFAPSWHFAWPTTSHSSLSCFDRFQSMFIMMTTDHWQKSVQFIINVLAPK